MIKKEVYLPESELMKVSLLSAARQIKTATMLKILVVEALRNYTEEITEIENKRKGGETNV